MRSRGYIVLISMIIISLLLVVIASTLSFTASWGRFNILDSEYKKNSLTLAEACVDNAILKIAQDQNYTGNETISVGTNTCSILSVTTAGNQKTIRAKAIFKKAVTNLIIKIYITQNPSSINIISWEEVAHF